MLILQANSKDHLLYGVDEDTDELIGPVCEECSVRQRVTNLIGGTIILWMELWVRGVQKFFPMDRGQLFNGGFMTELVQQGLTPPVNAPEVVDAIGDYLIEKDVAADEVYTHDKLGFHEITITESEKKLVFLTDEVIGCAGRDSHYYRPEVTAPKGTLDSWREFINQETIGHPYLELALAISVSGPIVHIFRVRGVYAENPIWTFIGKSSRGKTSALRVMASVYGSPAEGRGLIGDLNATENAFYAQLSNNIGLPHLIDEATSKLGWNFLPFSYNLAKGENKARCDSDGKLKERVQFSGPIVISGERSLFEQGCTEGGVYARMVEVNNAPWTSSADHADRILLKSHQNYGTAVKPIAKMLMNILHKGSDILEKKFYKELDFFRTELPNASGEEQRLLKMYATVVVSAQVANAALKINLDVDGLRNLLIQLHEKAPKASNLAEDLYCKVMDEVSQHGGNFPRRSQRNGTIKFSSDTWGEFATYKDQKVLWITGETFKKFAQPYQNLKNLLPDLHEQGLMIKFGDRFLTNHNLGYGAVKCYCLIERNEA